MSLHLDTDEDSPLRLSQTLCCPFPISWDCPYRVVGSVDGLVLLSDDLHGDTESMLILWNPSIRKSVTLPMPSFIYSSVGLYTFALGFRVDSATGDYKVVRLVYVSGEPPRLAQVYSLKDRTWRTVISDNEDDLVPPSGWTQCFIHGAVHWMGSKETGQNQYHQEILVFDLGTEEFKKMALPGVHDAQFSLFVVGGLLTVSAHPIVRDYRNVQAHNTDIWVKTDYYAADSWTKIASLNVNKLHVGDWLDLRRVCWEIPSGGGHARDPRDIQVPPSSRLLLERTIDHYVFSYTKSLVLLNEDKAAKRSAQHWRRLEQV